uniref:hypothetical protein n=1 Tax=Streptomyces minutiscleroticus TaxID=68238 RepID=UPI003570C430
MPREEARRAAHVRAAEIAGEAVCDDDDRTVIVGVSGVYAASIATPSAASSRACAGARRLRAAPSAGHGRGDDRVT